MPTTSLDSTLREIPMSFREKSAWICLVSTVAVFAPYFGYVFKLFAKGENTVAVYVVAFVGAVICQIMINIVAQSWVAIRTKQEPKDERDVAVEAKAYRNAYLVLIGLAWTVVFVPPPALVSMSKLSTPLFMGQLLLLCFIVAEATKYLTLVVCYRRGV